ncbi:Tho2 domain-containing protein [Aphelenchoides fujianensis]|nr:Tho2 domain-containing protein [Aphelenchoides fujianensis]
MKNARFTVVPQLMRFIYSCLLPRCIFSEVDAVYSARFIFLLHSVRTSWFPTLTLLDKLFHEITPLFSAFSENEATAFGKFLSLLLETTLRWHSKEEIFQEVPSLFCPLFVSRSSFRSATDSRASLAVQSAANPYDSFRTICYKWQLGMKTLVLVAYILLRNSFLILKKVINHFPLIKSHLPELEAAVTAVRDREKEKRPDLSLMAQSYLVVLKKRSADEFYNPASMNPKTPPSKDAAQDKKAPKEKEAAKEKDSPKEKDASKPKESSKANGTSKSNGASRQNSTAGNGDAPPTSSSQSSPASASLVVLPQAAHHRLALRGHPRCEALPARTRTSALVIVRH